MIRSGPFRLGLILAGSVAATAPLPIREANWIVPDRRVAALTQAPAECFVRPADPAEAALAMLGRSAFHAPLLLGGQGARAGVSCASCHRNGRGNPDFLFPGLSGAAGTADVTSSLMSSHRGDRIANPKPIPDLARDPPKVSHDPASPALRTFIRGLIVEEFDGPEPPPRVLDGLAAYVRALDGATCKGDVPITAASYLELAREASVNALAAMRDGDHDTTRLMVGGARAMLGKVDERFGRNTSSHRTLEALDRDLAALLAGLDQGGVDFAPGLERWQARLSAAARLIVREEAHSLFNPSRLEKALRR